MRELHSKYKPMYTLTNVNSKGFGIVNGLEVEDRTKPYVPTNPCPNI